MTYREQMCRQPAESDGERLEAEVLATFITIAEVGEHHQVGGQELEAEHLVGGDAFGPMRWRWSVAEEAEDCGHACHRAEQLDEHIGHQTDGRDALGGEETDGDGDGEVTSRDVPGGLHQRSDHRQHSQASGHHAQGRWLRVLLFI